MNSPPEERDASELLGAIRYMPRTGLFVGRSAARGFGVSGAIKGSHFGLGSHHVLLQLETDARRPELVSVTVDEHGLIFATRLFS
jgi:hypothetical protein